MGYQRPLIRLKFTDPELEGLEVTCRRLKVRDIAALSGLAALEGSIVDPQNQAALDMAVQTMADHIVDWNLEDETGEPIKPTVDALRDQDFGLLMALSNAWMGNAVGVPAPLSGPSEDGAPALVESIPMEPLSSSLAS